ncbi:MFS transporter [Aliiglaciecola sp. CAU 1673]|uniref:MFS transporter n=1 Tax=Aliiglaciecola sp. CAU 1673 TaxID=3032595 RepID=UPI0023DC76EE|nr:MFS transporter [Aliiglaciecola sp. CAU 1673]MDF2179044.1 MFS transporter [Aliiglaciecola sp. CAU 1673]
MINSSVLPVSKYQVAPSGTLAKIFLAFLATAGIFYINIMPALVSGLIDGLGFSNQQAGYISSSNLYGASIGALTAVLIVRRIRWKNWSLVLLLSILMLDFASIYLTQPWLLASLRFVHGLVGGLLVGIGFAVISRTGDADRAFGYLLFIQWGFGGLGLMYLPALVPDYGVSVLFYALMLFTAVTLMMLPFLPDYRVEQEIPQLTGALRPGKALVLTLVAIFLFQAANMGMFAYVIGLGRTAGLTLDFISPALALASWIALAGSALVIVIGTKFGRTRPLLMGILVTALATWLLHYSELDWVYAIFNILIGITWAFALPFLFGICSELDPSGKLAALGGFCSKMGLASGPLVAGILLGEDNYGAVINIAAMGLLLCAAAAFWPARRLDG